MNCGISKRCLPLTPGAFCHLTTKIIDKFALKIQVLGRERRGKDASQEQRAVHSNLVKLPGGPISGLIRGTRADEVDRFQTGPLFRVLGSSDFLKAMECH